MLTDNEQETINALKRAGFGDDDIAAIMGNIAVETGNTFDHTQKQKGGGGGYGLFQFTGRHKDDYFDWIKGNKIPDTHFSQAKFVHDNIYATGEYGHDLGWRARGVLQESLDEPVPTPMALSKGGQDRVERYAPHLVSEKTRTFANVYEKAGKPHMDRRIKSAHEWHKKWREEELY